MKRLFCKKVLGGFALVLMGAFVAVPTAMAADVAGATISGFVDVSYSDADNSNGTFGLDQIEVDIEKDLSDKLSLRVDVNYLPNTALGFDDLIEQGYLTIRLDNVGTGLDVTLGKFNAPIGFELLDPVDMYQFSHALVFDNGLPTNLTGVMGAYKVSDMVDVAAYVVNGWDISSADNNQNKTIGARVGIDAMPGVAVGVSLITGTIETAGNTADKKTVLDIDATITMVDNLTIGLEYNSGTIENGNLAGTGDGDWTGLLVMAHYDLDDTYGVTARYDTFDDEGGAKLGNSVVEKQSAITLAGTMSLGDGAGLLAEWRRLDSDKNVFNNSTADSTDTFAVEFTYSF